RGQAAQPARHAAPAGSPTGPITGPNTIVCLLVASYGGHGARTAGSPSGAKPAPAERTAAGTSANTAGSNAWSIGAPFQAGALPNTNGSSMQWQALKRELGGAQSNW